jgi:hypothetical protein
LLAESVFEDGGGAQPESIYHTDEAGVRFVGTVLPKWVANELTQANPLAIVKEIGELRATLVARAAIRDG